MYNDYSGDTEMPDTVLDDLKESELEQFSLITDYWLDEQEEAARKLILKALEADEMDYEAIGRELCEQINEVYPSYHSFMVDYD